MSIKNIIKLMGPAVAVCSAALYAGGAQAAGFCDVVTDAANDAPLNADLLAVRMATESGDLAVSIDTGSLDNSNGGSPIEYHVLMTYDTGQRYLMRAYGLLTVGEGFGAQVTTWEDSGFGGYFYDELQDIPAPELDAGTLTLRAPMKMIGSPANDVDVQVVSVNAFWGDPWALGAFIDETDPAVYTIGDSCAKSADYAGAHYSDNQSLKSVAAPNLQGAGALSWLLIGLTAFGLRRRFFSTGVQC